MTTRKNEGTASEAQLAANRSNAKRSTGPTSPEGKLISRMNAVRHGLAADTPLLPGEDAEDRELLFAGLHRDLAPEGAWEEELVERIGDAMWRLRRVARVETALFAYRMLEGLKGDGSDRLGAVLPIGGVLPGATYRREDLRVEGLYVFNESAESLADQSVAIGRAFLRDVKSGNALGQLGRHETTIMRSLRNAINMLVEAQQRRASKTEPLS